MLRKGPASIACRLSHLAPIHFDLVDDMLIASVPLLTVRHGGAMSIKERHTSVYAAVSAESGHPRPAQMKEGLV